MWQQILDYGQGSRDFLTSRAELSPEYVTEEVRNRFSRLRIALILCIIFVPGGVTLDLFVYREHFAELFAIRLFVSVILIGLLVLLLRVRDSLRIVSAISVANALINNLAFCWMVYLTEGALSPYYAGVNLIILGLSVLLLSTWRETFIVCSISVVAYTLACLFNLTISQPEAAGLLYNNLFFIGITSLVCVGSAHLQSQARYRDFELRDRLNRQNVELQDLDRLKTSFFSNITHELRTPLTLILGPTEALLRHEKTQDQGVHDQLILIQKNSDRLLRLINDLLDLSRMEEQCLQLRVERLDLRQFLRGLIDEVRHRAVSQGLKIKSEFPLEPVMMEADPDRLEKVVLNLLTNAIKFTPSGGVITLRLESGDGCARFAVEDTGIGIGNEEIARIFERFYQVRGHAKLHTQGVGIGLALVKALVDLHQGKLEVSSVPQQGTTFTITLPLQQSEAQAVPQPVPTSTVKPSALIPNLTAAALEPPPEIDASAQDDDCKITGKGEHTLLLVEDETGMRQFIESALEKDYRIVSLQHGAKLAERIAKFSPDVIVLDWMLPFYSGFELCQQIRADEANSDRKIVILTARADEKSKIAALGAGADDFLPKPFNSLELNARLRNLQQTAVLQQALRKRNLEIQDALDKLAAAKNQLIQSEKVNALGTLAAGIMHEIGNPLNAVYGGVQVLEMKTENVTESLRPLIADIRESAERVSEIMQNLHEFAYPGQPGARTLFAIKEAVHSAKVLSKKEIAGVTLVEDLPDEILIQGEKNQWTHVFINLLINAAKAVAAVENPVRKELNFSAKHEDGMVAIYCADTGTGIDPEIQERVFDPFFTTRDVGSGMGMGLAICKTVIENHGGSISLLKQPDFSTTFVIKVPKP